MVVVHVASGTRDILVFWAAWPRLWATPYRFLYSNIFHSNHQRMLPPQVINLLIEPVRLFINQLKVKVEDDSSKN
jgi:hypothetical protein